MRVSVVWCRVVGGFVVLGVCLVGLFGLASPAGAAVDAVAADEGAGGLEADGPRAVDVTVVTSITVGSAGSEGVHARISANGHYAVYVEHPGTADAAVMRVDLASGEALRIAGPGHIARPEVSGDGSHVVFVQADTPLVDEQVYLWTAADGRARPISPVRTTSPWVAPKISDDGQRIVWLEQGSAGQGLDDGSCGDDWEAVVWGPADNEIARRQACHILAVSGDGRFVYLEPRIGVEQARWDIGTGELAWFAGGSANADGSIVAVPDPSAITLRVEGRPPFAVDVPQARPPTKPTVLLSGTGTVLAVTFEDDVDDAGAGEPTSSTSAVVNLVNGAVIVLPVDAGTVRDSSFDARWWLADTPTAPGERSLVLIDLDPTPPAPQVGDLTAFGRDDGVALLQRAYTGGPGDASSLYFLESQQAGGRTVASISAILARSPEFQAGPGGLDDRAFAEWLYTDVLGRTPEPAAVDIWVGQLEQGVSRSDIMVRITASPEFIARATVDPAGADAAVLIWRLYDAYFDRTPDQWGFDHWYRAWQRGVSMGEISAAFAATDAFGARFGSVADDDDQFVERAYRELLGRPADDEGLAYWTGQLSAGLPRSAMMLTIAGSAEFAVRDGSRLPRPVGR
ncbi:MAG: DUF4214 domain-containing protein [Actinomycetota bacterium]